MKYKDINLELPPVGELLVTTSEGRGYYVGYFLKNNDKKRLFFELAFFDLSKKNLDRFFLGIETEKWAPLPKFKSVKDDPPPVGEIVLFKLSDEKIEEDTDIREHAFSMGCLLKGQKKYVNEVQYDEWIEMNVFQEDK